MTFMLDSTTHISPNHSARKNPTPSAIYMIGMRYNTHTTKVLSGATNTLSAANRLERSAMNSIPHASGIYQILCVPTGKIYIGSSRDIAQRLSSHQSMLRLDNHHNRYLQSAWNKYGVDAFTFSVVEIVDPSRVLEREQYWLDDLRPYDHERGFNIGLRAESIIGIKRSPEYVEALTERARARMTDPERRAAVSRVHKGKAISDAQKAAITEKLSGLKRPPEVIAKYSSARARDYVVTDPEGTVYEVRNLSMFCKEHGLNQAGMYCVGSGLRSQYRGWTCRHK